MTIKEALKKYHKIEIELLLAHVLKKPKEFVFMHEEKKLSSYQVSSLSSLIKCRLKGEPIAYILGYKDFYGLRFKVNRRVLIPRPETEMVVDLVSAKLRSSPLLRGDAPSASEGQRGCKNPELAQPLPSPLLKRRGGLRGIAVKILDVGTGSGNIIISLAKSLSQRSKVNCQMFASDISSAALKIAKQNAKSHNAKIKFIQSDLLKNVRGDFDIIIANLPYVPNEDLKFLIEDLRFEPKRAIFAKEHGLLLIRRLLNQIADKKQKPRLIYLEFDPRQKSELLSLIKKSLPGSEIKFYKDYNNFWRYVEIEN